MQVSKCEFCQEGRARMLKFGAQSHILYHIHYGIHFAFASVQMTKAKKNVMPLRILEEGSNFPLLLCEWEVTEVASRQEFLESTMWKTYFLRRLLNQNSHGISSDSKNLLS